MNTLAITSTVKKYPVNIPYEAIKRKILGEKYALSLVFVGTTRAKTLNQRYRKKSYVPNVLSFPLTEMSGEIFICSITATREAHRFNLSPNGHIAFLFIHGCLHLKGYDHGDTMDTLEHKLIKMFNIS